jgi:hypothetical protein
MSRVVRRTILLFLGALAFASPVIAHDDDDHVSKAGVCTKSSSSRLDLRRDSSGPGSGRIDVTFTVRARRSGVVWRVVLLHDRRIVFRGTRRTRPPRASFVLQQTLDDWYGSETVTARATSPRGEVCRASAKL